jgi:aspartyl-tRNA(Asn)/glutamyl-tRNA(Gln) amidotransferase subunit A
VSGLDVGDLTVGAIAAGVREGSLRAQDVLAAFTARIDALDPTLHAFSRRCPALAQERAAAIDAIRAAGHPLPPLAGVPVGLKDIFVTEGVETTCGSRILRGWVPPAPGTHDVRLREAGAVLVAKCAMDEFAMGSSSENTRDPPPANPWDTAFVPGGSSGGSAVAVAAGLVPFALGSDTGGSIRQPASLCGIVGLKPTYGRVSRHGMIAFASSLDQAGPMTRTVRDAALVLEVIAGHDPLDATSMAEPPQPWRLACDRGAVGRRVGVHRAALDHEGLDPDVRAAFDRALEVLVGAGATLVDIELPHFQHAIATYYVLCAAEASSNLARYDGVRYGLRVEGPTLQQTYEATRTEGFGDEVKRRILLGTFVLRKASYAEYYGRAQRVRTLIARDYDAAFARCDVIASPASPVPGFRFGDKTADPLAMYLSDVFTIGANLAGLPAIVIPAGFAPARADQPRLPIGLQLQGPRGREDLVLAIAAAHEDATSHHRERPPIGGA